MVPILSAQGMTQEQCLQLIELYKNRDFMWNPKNKNYFNRNKREDAWKEISSLLNLPISTLKAKMKALLGSYRSEKSKENKSRVAGSGTDEGYESKWFAYQHLEFLRSRDTPTLDTASTTEFEETTDTPSCDIDTSILGNSSQYSPAEGIPSPMSSAPTTTGQDDTFTPPPAKRVCKGKRVVQEDETQAMMSTPQQVLQPSVSASSDPYYIYALHLANELRKYDPLTLASVKRAFANIIYDADMTTYGSQHLLSNGPSSPVVEDTTPEHLEPII